MIDWIDPRVDWIHSLGISPGIRRRGDANDWFNVPWIYHDGDMERGRKRLHGGRKRRRSCSIQRFDRLGIHTTLSPYVPRKPRCRASPRSLRGASYRRRSGRTYSTEFVFWLVSSSVCQNEISVRPFTPEKHPDDHARTYVRTYVRTHQSVSRQMDVHVPHCRRR